VRIVGVFNLVVLSTYKRTIPDRSIRLLFITEAVESNLHSPERRLIDLRIEHGDLDAMIDRASDESPLDELLMRRLKKKRLSLRDEIARLERLVTPDEPA
jgi:hypothetical protein